ncbi:MAG: hypothetical protein IPF82_06945 [Blastocatellia bacterium]|nr:hypothetical protein [Blastocatellia bacterium]
MGYVLSTHTLGGPADEYEEDFLARPLSELGVPRLDILTARGRGGLEVSFELSGDAGATLGWHAGEDSSVDEEAANART